MTDANDTNALLREILENQRSALKLQQEHLELARAQLERSNLAVTESIDLQRAAVARQSQVMKIIFPLIGILLVLLGYLLIRWNIL